MSRGGKRQGAGRPKGSATRVNEAARKKAADGGLMPLDYMLGLLRNEAMPMGVRFDAAKAAAPYVHAKLASVEHSGADGGPLQVVVKSFTLGGE